VVKSGLRVWIVLGGGFFDELGANGVGVIARIVFAAGRTGAVRKPGTLTFGAGNQLRDFSFPLAASRMSAGARTANFRYWHKFSLAIVNQLTNFFLRA
jgi:hypothetical protein